ncbi:hypothetical protein D3C80_670710 [compost metagenome]
MNGLQTLYLESLLNIQLGSMNYNATEFSGHIDIADIEKLCNEGMLSWQNPHAPRGHIAYVVAHFDHGQDYKLSIDTKTNTIVVCEESAGLLRVTKSLSNLKGVQQVGRIQRHLH